MHLPRGAACGELYPVYSGIQCVPQRRDDKAVTEDIRELNNQIAGFYTFEQVDDAVRQIVEAY